MDQKPNPSTNLDNFMSPIGLKTGQYRITQDFKLTSDSPPQSQSTYRLKKISIIPLNLDNIQSRVKSQTDNVPLSTSKPSWPATQTKRGEYRIDDFGLFNSAPRYHLPPTPIIGKGSPGYSNLSNRPYKVSKTHVTSQSLSRGDGGQIASPYQLVRKASDASDARNHMANYMPNYMGNMGKNWNKGPMNTPKRMIDILGNDSSVSDLLSNGRDNQDINIILPTVSSTREKPVVKPAIRHFSPKSKGIPKYKKEKMKGSVGIGDIRDSIKPILSRNNRMILKSGRLFVDSTKLLMDNQKRFL